jgi:hypothetical protein
LQGSGAWISGAQHPADGAIQQHPVRNGSSEMRAGRKFRIYVDGVIITGQIGKAVKILLAKAAFKRCHVSNLDFHNSLSWY